MNTAFSVYELEPVEHAFQDVAHAALCEGGFVQELVHVALVQVENEADVKKLTVQTFALAFRRCYSLQPPEEANVE